MEGARRQAAPVPPSVPHRFTVGRTDEAPPSVPPVILPRMTADTPLTLPDGRPVLFHMIKEHARLNGHAGILRESIGGVTGA